MATLASLSNLNGSDRGAAALATFLERSFVLRFFEQQSAFEQDATAFDYLPVDGTANVQTRAVGGSFTASAKTPPARQNGTLAIYGDAIEIDRTHLADAANGLRDIDTWLTGESRQRVIATASYMDAAVMKDPGTGTTMKGLNVILNGTNDIPGFTGVKGVINAKTVMGGTNSFDFTSTAAATQATQDAFIEGMNKCLVEVPDAAAILLNRTFYGRVNSVARRAHILGESRDLFGRPIPTFNGVPLIAVPDTAILNTEGDDAAGTNTTSLYIVRPGEGTFSLVTNEGLYYKEFEQQEGKVSSKENYEIRLAWKINDKEAVRRVRNFKI